MKKVLIYACIEKNIGDDLFIHTLCERYPNCEFYISSDAKYGDIEKIENIKFSRIFNIWQKASYTSNRRGIKLFISKIIDYVCSIYLKRFDTSVYVVGNAFKCYKYEGKKQSEWFRKRVELTNKFFLLSTNFGPYDDYKWVIDFKENFSKLTHVCFRDKNSYSLFKELKNVSWAPDVVLSLGRNLSLNYKKENQILISIIDCSFKTRPDSIKNYQYDYENKIIELAINYISKGYKVKILTSNNEQDYPTAIRIKNECVKKINKEPDIIQYNGDYKMVFEEYKKSKYVVATRLHAIILAWIYNIPVVPIIYDIKVKSLLDSYMFDGLRIDMESIRNISIEDINTALINYNFNNLSNLYYESEKQFEILDKILI